MRRLILFLPILLSACDPLGNSTPASFTLLMAGQSNSEERFHMGDYFMTQITAGRKQVVYASRGGTLLREWAPGKPLYQQLVAGMKVADVVIWWQGETDTEVQFPKEAKTWAKRWVSIMKHARRDAGRSPRIMAVVLGQGRDTAGWYLVQEQQRQAFRRLPNVTPIEIENIPQDLRIKDDVHYTEAGYEYIGRLIADAYNGDR